VALPTYKYDAVISGCTHACDGGSVVLRGGATTSGAGGAVHMLGQDSLHGADNSAGGMVYIRSGASTGSGGAVHMLSGYSSTASSGLIHIQTGEGLGTATSGKVTLASGDACNGDTGTINLQTGNAEVGSSGGISLVVGTGTGIGGDILVSAGSSSGDTGNAGGSVTIGAGDGANSTTSTGGVGGSVTILAGSGAEGVNAASGAAGGDMTIDTGPGGGSANDGSLYIGLNAYSIEIGKRDHSRSITANGLMSVTTSLQIGGGAAVRYHHSIVSSEVDPPLLLPTQGWYQDLAFPNILLGDVVVVSFSNSIAHGMVTCSVVGTNTVRILVSNPGTGDLDLDLAPGTFRMSVWQYTS